MLHKYSIFGVIAIAAFVTLGSFVSGVHLFGAPSDGNESLPDLIVANFSVVDSVLLPTSTSFSGPYNVTLQSSILNIGDATANRTFTRFSIVNGSNAVKFTSPLVPGNSRNIMASFTLDLGEYEIVVTADTFDDVPESNEENNELRAEFSVP